MRQELANFVIANIPMPLAIVDKKLNLIDCSTPLLNNFTLNKKNIIGKNLFEAISDVPIKFNKAIRFGLSGHEEINNGEKFTLPNGKILWLKWKISPVRNDEDQVTGLMILLEDLTEYKKELELLHKAEAVARIGGWEVDLLKNTIYWTQTTREIHEVDDDFIPDLEKGINFYKKGYHRDKITEIVSTAIEKGKPWDTELIIVTAKGNEVWVRAKGEVEMVNNKATRIIGTFQDINKTKKAELEYKKVSERLQIATNTAKIGIWDYDIEQNQLVWDANMFELYGIREDDFAGVFEAWQAGVHPDDLERGNLEIQNAISNKKKFDTEFRVLWPNGEIRNIRAIARSIKDSNGKTIKLVGANWDITEMKTTRLQLARSIESFEETFENVAIGMAVVSPDFKFIKINKSLTYSLGYSEKELLKLKTLDITHPEDIFKTKELYEKAYEGKEDTYQIEKRYFHKTGYIVHVILVITVVKEINGQPLHAIAQFLDITDRIEAEKKSKLLVEVTKEQNDSLINFAHIVSHNLRSHSTNLNMLTSFLNLEKDEAEREHINTMITKAAGSLSETIAHLNDVVQARTGTLENLTSVNVLSTIEQIKNSIGGLLEEQGAELYIEVSKFHFVNAVPAYLESIFLNILTNSLKYKAPDRAPKIKIKSISKENKIGVSFADNGQGIDLERHGDKIFGMYKTFHKHKDAKGIGLFITKNQIEAMNGSIQIESKVNLGTTLLIELQKG